MEVQSQSDSAQVNNRLRDLQKEDCEALVRSCCWQRDGCEFHGAQVLDLEDTCDEGHLRAFALMISRLLSFSDRLIQEHQMAPKGDAVLIAIDRCFYPRRDLVFSRNLSLT